MAIQQLPLPKSGIPTGTTAQRPASPATGDVFYNGTLGILEIYDGTNWIPCSAPPAAPSIVSVTDIGTGRAFGSSQATINVSTGIGGGPTVSYTGIMNISGTDYTATTTATTITVTGGNAGTYTISSRANNGFGSSLISSTQNIALTTVPQAPTIGTATASTTAPEVTVTWTLGANGGKNLTALEVIPYIGSTAQTATSVSTSATSVTLSLSLNTTYTFRVKATNANGAGLESNATNAVTTINSLTVDYVVVAGGGGGAHGGGGGGGFRTSAGTSGRGSAAEASLSLVGGTAYTVTVGAGGAGNTVGNNSVFATITSSGGGKGGVGGAGVGGNGGCGGGCSFDRQNAGGKGLGTTAQGQDGGDTSNGGSDASAAGGGGASAVGTNGAASGNRLSSGSAGAGGGNGGAGQATSISGSSVTYAGGGGGGSNVNGSNVGVLPTGGAGGGGNGSTTSSGTGQAGTAGSVNTGGGGGGGDPEVAGGDYRAGGSGIVILKIPAARTATFSGGVTQTTDSTSVSGFKIITITAAGTSDTVTFS